MINQQNILQRPIEYLKGVGPARAELLKKELSIFTFSDLLNAYPYRYVDKTQFHRITDIGSQSDNVQIKGILRRLSMVGEGRKRRLVGRLRDDSGSIELVWFKGAQWIQNQLEVGKEYVIFGRVNNFRGQLNIAHPEMEAVSLANQQKATSFAPVYPSTEKLNNKGRSGRPRTAKSQENIDAVWYQLP